MVLLGLTAAAAMARGSPSSVRVVRWLGVVELIVSALTGTGALGLAILFLGTSDRAGGLLGDLSALAYPTCGIGVYGLVTATALGVAVARTYDPAVRAWMDRVDVFGE